MSLTLAILCDEWRQIIQDMNNLLAVQIIQDMLCSTNQLFILPNFRGCT